ncbi:unnamed protein product, partial [Heligmosomoides polygyrus]|uniref:Protein tyrosine phosphatase n=1 Tax=Heligmosomoides polygyrus TaxID=6339 RepID=A0A183GT93_HELPZ
GVLSDVYEEHAFEEKPSHWEPHVTPPSPPARTEDYVEDISSQTAQQYGQEMLTQEELDHIAHIRRLGEESTSADYLHSPPPQSASCTLNFTQKEVQEEYDFGPPRHAASIELETVSAEEEKEASEESETTSGADEENCSDFGSMDVMPTYERSSPLLEDVDALEEEQLEEDGELRLSYPHGREALNNTEVPVNSLLSDFGSMDVMPAYERSSPLLEDVDAIEDEQLEEDGELRLSYPHGREALNNTGFPAKSLLSGSYIEEVATLPHLQTAQQSAREMPTHEKHEHIAYIGRLTEEPTDVALLPSPPFSPPTTKDEESRKSPLPGAEQSPFEMLSQEKVDRIAYVQRLTEESSQLGSIPARSLPPLAIVEEKSSTSPLRTSQQRAVEMLTQQELDHIASIQRLAEDFPGSGPLPPLPLPFSKMMKEDSKKLPLPRAKEPSGEILTQEELDHIAYVQRLAEESSSLSPLPPFPLPSSKMRIEESKKPALPAQQSPLEMLTQEELDHIAYVQRLAEESSELGSLPRRPLLSSSIVEERPSRSPLKTDQQRAVGMLTQEELDHIAYVQRLALESSGLGPLAPLLLPPSLSTIELTKGKLPEKDEYDLPSYEDYVENKIISAGEETDVSGKSGETSGADDEIPSGSEYEVTIYNRSSSSLDGDDISRRVHHEEKEDDKLQSAQVYHKQAFLHTETPTRTPSAQKCDVEGGTGGVALETAQKSTEGMLSQEELDHSEQPLRGFSAAFDKSQKVPPSADQVGKAVEGFPKQDELDLVDISRSTNRVSAPISELEKLPEKSDATADADLVRLSEFASTFGSLMYRRTSSRLEDTRSNVNEETNESEKADAEQMHGQPILFSEGSFNDSYSPLEHIGEGTDERCVNYEHGLHDEAKVPEKDQHSLEEQSLMAVELPQRTTLSAEVTTNLQDDAAAEEITGRHRECVPQGMLSTVDKRDERPKENIEATAAVGHGDSPGVDDSDQLHSSLPSPSQEQHGEVPSEHAASESDTMRAFGSNTLFDEIPPSAVEATQRQRAVPSFNPHSVHPGGNPFDSEFQARNTNPGGKRASLFGENKRARLKRGYSTTDGMNGSERPDILSRSTSVNYSTNVSQDLLQRSFTGRRTANQRNSSSSKNSTGKKQEPPAQQGSRNVRVIYTDHSLRESQSSYPGNASDDEDDILSVDPFDDGAVRKTNSEPWPEIGVTVDTFESPDEAKIMRRSLSEVADGAESPAQETLRFSRSSNCVASICSQSHAFLNAYELCEQHSFTDSRDLLCNVDFLCRLNFAAHRLTEDIADEAGRDLRIHFRAQSNPRARYFTDTSLTRHSTSMSSFDDDQSTGWVPNFLQSSIRFGKDRTRLDVSFHFPLSYVGVIST